MNRFPKTTEWLKAFDAALEALEDDSILVEGPEGTEDWNAWIESYAASEADSSAFAN